MPKHYVLINSGQEVELTEEQAKERLANREIYECHAEHVFDAEALDSMLTTVYHNTEKRGVYWTRPQRETTNA